MTHHRICELVTHALCECGYQLDAESDQQAENLMYQHITDAHERRERLRSLESAANDEPGTTCHRDEQRP